MVPPATQIGWQDYVAIILRRRWFFIIPCVATVVVASVVGLFLPKIYRAETILLIQDRQVINPLIQGLAVSTPIGERVRILREELLSWSSLGRLVDHLRLDPQAHNPVAYEQLIKRLQKTINVQLRGRELILISYEDHDPKLAQALVNTLTDIYMKRHVESQTAEAGTAISFLESEIGVYQKTLEDAERALREFQELYVMQMPVATQLNQQVIDLEVRLAQLLVENTERHPLVVETKRQIEELKRKRNEEIKHVIASAIAQGHDAKLYEDLATTLEEPVGEATAQSPTVKAAKEAYQAWVSRFDGSLASAPATGPRMQVITKDEDASSTVEVLGSGATSLSLAPRQQQELARLSRDYDVHARTYQHMQERLERAKITQRLGESDEGAKFKVLEPARLPLRPVRPNRMKLAFFSLLLGIFLGAGVAFVAEYLDQSFQSAEEVQEALALPVIGSISTIVTDGDLAKRRQRMKGWLSLKSQLERLKTFVINPVWAYIDKALLRWGL